VEAADKEGNRKWATAVVPFRIECTLVRKVTVALAQVWDTQSNNSNRIAELEEHRTMDELGQSNQRVQ
jgi:hypothetical protein